MSYNDCIETIEKDNCKIEIYPDDNAWNPREWTNLGTMVCSHSRYDLGDKQIKKDETEEFMEWLQKNKDKLIVLPLYLYDHSGISMSTSHSYPYNDVWDSGLVGFIYVEYQKIREEYGWKHITKSRKEKIVDYLRNEIEVYDQYLTGDVYGYQVICSQCEEEIDSCWGFYGSNWNENGLLDQAYTTCKHCEEMEQSLERIQ